MKKVVKVLLAMAPLLVAGLPVYSLCSHSPDDVYYCSAECTWDSYGVYCGVSEDDFRACWYSRRACGESSYYEECDCTGGVGGF